MTTTLILALAVAALFAFSGLARRAGRKLDSIGLPNLSDRCHALANYSGVMAWGMAVGTVNLLVVLAVA